MIKKKVFTITVLVLTVVIVIQTVIIIKPSVLGGHEVTTPENAILLAKAALLREYGEAEINREFVACIIYDNEDYWYVSENLNSYGYPPRVYVRRCDGKVILRWR